MSACGLTPSLPGRATRLAVPRGRGGGLASFSTPRSITNANANEKWAAHDARTNLEPIDLARLLLDALAADLHPLLAASSSAAQTTTRHDGDTVRAVTPPRPAQVLDAEKLAEREHERAEVERAQAGDRQAMGALLRRHGPMLYRAVLLPRLGNQAAAEEALSVVYAKVIERIHQFTWQSVGIFPWLRMVAMRVALDQLRARKREMPLDVDDLQREVDRADRTSDHGTDAPTLAREDAENAKRRIELALSQLHPRYAQAIRSRVLEEQPREAVAAELGVTVATFDVVLHRAMAALKKALAETAEEASQSEGTAP
jgi:RNA polymerase sigma factor (sigma-70 family)